MKANAIREMSDEQLREQIDEREKDIVHFRRQLTTGAVDNVRAAREARRDIARLKTIQRERAHAASKGNQ